MDYKIVQELISITQEVNDLETQKNQLLLRQKDIGPDNKVHAELVVNELKTQIEELYDYLDQLASEYDISYKLNIDEVDIIGSQSSPVLPSEWYSSDC
jgi:hypothetical protein